MTVNPYDDATIVADDTIIRRINPVYHVVWDENRSRYRVSTKAYSPSSEPLGGMSVDIEKSILAAGLEGSEFVTNPTFTGSVAFPAGRVRNLGLLVGYDPIFENLHHGEVWSAGMRPNRFSDQQKKGLAAVATWYVELPDVDIR